MKSTIILISICLIATLAIPGTIARDEGEGGISGKIYDGLGRLLQGAEVELSRDGKIVGSTRTDEPGSYEVGNLPAGHYVVSVQLRGFSRAERCIWLRPGEHIHQDISLQVGILIEPIKLSGIVR